MWGTHLIRMLAGFWVYIWWQDSLAPAISVTFERARIIRVEKLQTFFTQHDSHHCRRLCSSFLFFFSPSHHHFRLSLARNVVVGTTTLVGGKLYDNKRSCEWNKKISCELLSILCEAAFSSRCHLECCVTFFSPVSQLVYRSQHSRRHEWNVDSPRMLWEDANNRRKFTSVAFTLWRSFRLHFITWVKFPQFFAAFLPHPGCELSVGGLTKVPNLIFFEV